MKKFVIIFFIILSLITASCNGKEKSKTTIDYQTEDEIIYPLYGTINGVIRLIGNEPFTELVITGTLENVKEKQVKDYKIIGKYLNELMGKQLYEIGATGKIDRYFLKFAGDTDKGTYFYSIDIEKYELFTD